MDVLATLNRVFREPTGLNKQNYDSGEALTVSLDQVKLYPSTLITGVT